MKMYITRKCLYFISIIIIFSIIKLACADKKYSTTNSLRILQAIIQMESWKRGLLKEEIYVDGKLKNFYSFVSGAKDIDEYNIEQVSSAMYMALECDLSVSIKGIILKALIALKQDKKLHAFILRMMSVLFDFINIAPNVISMQPGFLAILLLLEVRIAKLFQYNPEDTYVEVIKLDMLTIVDRFIIKNCRISDLDVEIKFKKDGYCTVTEVMSDVKDFLDDTGLLTNTFDKAYDAIKIDGELVQLTTFNFMFYEIVNKLGTILFVDRESLKKQMFAIQNDTLHMVYYTELLHDSIIQIIYKKTLETLIQFEDFIKAENKTMIQSTKMDWISDDLDLICDKIIQTLNYLKFPLHFIHSIELIKNIFDGILKGKNNAVKKMNVIQIKEKLNTIQRKYGDSQLTLIVATDESKIATILGKVLGIDEFIYIHQIYNVLQSGPVEYDLLDIQINEIDYLDTSYTDVCKNLFQLYVYFSDLQSNCILNKFSRKNENLQESFLTILKIFENMEKDYESQNGDNSFKIIVSWLHRYLINNVKYFNENNVQHIRRTLYVVTNMMDKLQINRCKPSRMRGCVNRNYMLNKYNKYSERSTKSEHTKFVLQNFVNSIQINEVRNKVDNDFSTEETFKYSSIQAHIQGMSNLDLSAFYWKGTPRIITQIITDCTINMHDNYSFIKYVNTLHKWIVSQLFKVIISYFKLFLNDNTLLNTDHFLAQYIQKLKTINFPTYVYPTLNIITNTSIVYNQENVLSLIILLENHLEEHGVIQNKAFPSGDKNSYKKLLDDIFDKLSKIYSTNNDLA